MKKRQAAAPQKAGFSKCTLHLYALVRYNQKNTGIGKRRLGDTLSGAAAAGRKEILRP